MKKIILSLIISILVSTVYSQATKDEFCKTFTENAQQGQGFTKSYFKYIGNTFIQVMDINEMSGDKEIEYEFIVKEASNPEFRRLITTRILQQYSSIGINDILHSNGFTHFQLYLLKKDGSKIISEIYKL